MGIEANRITAIGYGETKPLVANDTSRKYERKTEELRLE